MSRIFINIKNQFITETAIRFAWRRTVFLLFLLFIISILFSACDKSEQFLDVVPKITLKEIEPLTVQQFVDTIGIVIEYEDGDGDVGDWNPDELSLSVHDQRLANPDFYYVRPLTPDSNVLAITGTIRITIRNTFLLGNGNSETTRYDIRLKDRAGNWSNTVTTPQVVILR